MSILNPRRLTSIDLTSILPVLAYLLWGYVLADTHGHLQLDGLVILTLVWIGLLWFWFKKKYEIKDGFKWAYLISSILILSSTELIYAEDNNGTLILELLGDAQIFLPVLYWFYSLRNHHQNLNRIVWCSAIVMVMMLCLVPWATPVPHIDVYYVLNGATEYILQGINPYGAQYPDIYNGALGYTPDFVYWPGLLYPAIIFKFLAWDVRYAQVASIVVSLLLFSYFNPQQRQYSLLFLMMPISFFVLEQSWLDSLMFPYIVLLLEGLKRSSLPLTTISLGYLAASRQTNLFLIILVLVYVWQNCDRRFFLKVCAGSGAVTGLLMAPFLLWDFSVFIQHTILQVLQYPASSGSLSWASFLLANYNISPSSNLFLLITFCLSLGIGYRAKNIRELLVSIVVVHLFFLLTLQQSFCNYYYYISFYLFLFLAHSSSTQKFKAEQRPEVTT